MIDFFTNLFHFLSQQRLPQGTLRYIAKLSCKVQYLSYLQHWLLRPPRGLAHNECTTFKDNAGRPGFDKIIRFRLAIGHDLYKRVLLITASPA
jgi:hypothetical protein